MIESGFFGEVTQIAADGRALAEARMDSVCRIRYRTGQSAMVDGVEQFVYADRATNVPCRVHPTDASGQDTTPAAMAGVRVLRTISIPWDSVEVRPGDLVELTMVGALTDASLAGKTFRVVDPAYASQTTARRLQVEEDA